MADSRCRRVTDPHIKWEAQRQALASRYDKLSAIPDGMSPDDYDDQLDAVQDAEQALIDKIKTIPTKTVEGALCVIEALDRYETWMGLTHLSDRIQQEFEARASAVATIRRLTSPRKRKPRDLRPKWLRRWRRLQEEFTRRYMEIEGHDAVPDHVDRLLCQIRETEWLLKNTMAKTPRGAAAQLGLVYAIAVDLEATRPEVTKPILERVIAFLEERKS